MGYGCCIIINELEVVRLMLQALFLYYLCVYARADLLRIHLLSAFGCAQEHPLYAFLFRRSDEHHGIA